MLVNELLGEVVPAIEAFVIDNCDTNADYEVAETILGEEDGVQTLERIYTASDACGNTTVFNQLITVTLAFEGCTDTEACNYDASANVDDGSCESTSCVGCTDPEASNYDPLATIADDGSCQYCELTLETTLLQGLTCAGDNNAQVALDISN